MGHWNAFINIYVRVQVTKLSYLNYTVHFVTSPEIKSAHFDTEGKKCHEKFNNNYIKLVDP